MSCAASCGVSGVAAVVFDAVVAVLGVAACRVVAKKSSKPYCRGLKPRLRRVTPTSGYPRLRALKPVRFRRAILYNFRQKVVWFCIRNANAHLIPQCYFFLGLYQNRAINLRRVPIRTRNNLFVCL
jgi:hypothetical protein